jgi:hypothetical protein
MKAPSIGQFRAEKPTLGWFGGCNSVKTPFLLPDNQYVWGVNVVNRGGVVQTRPGRRLWLTAPSGNFQGARIFSITNTESALNKVIVFAVDGKVYYSPFENGQPVQPANWESYRLKNISFQKSAKKIYWEVAEKSVQQTESSINIVPTYTVLMMQDGTTAAGYWDGVTNAHLNENSPALETPIGTWMKSSGGRLWVARGTYVIASDLLDPLKFSERVEGTVRGDYSFDGEITGLTTSIGDNRKSNLIVFTEENTSTLLSSITDREKWETTDNFQTELFPSVGCVAGKSIINHAGLLWWYSHGGLVNSDSAAAAFLTSKISYRDVEMGRTKRNLAPDLSGACAASFESYLLVSVPSGDELNGQTMVLDYSISDELNGESSPAWNGIWTGIRPVEWFDGTIDGEKRLFSASIDYQALPNDTTGSFNHIWEEFQSDRNDSYETIDANNTRTLVKNKIFCSFETKQLGDGMDLKTFLYAEADLIEIGGEVNFKMSYAGATGGYHEIANKKIIATIEAEGIDNDTLQEMYERIGPFKVQSRRVTTQNAIQDVNAVPVESRYDIRVSKAFSLLFQWCGRCGIESTRVYLEQFAEPSEGRCEEDETGINVVTQDGTSFQIE